MKLLEIFAKRDDLCSLDGTGKCSGGLDFDGFVGAFGKNIVSSLFVIAGILSVIMIIVCGIMMMVSAGDPGKVAKAKKGMLAAVIGLIISICAAAIATAVVNALG
jgi:hypothetical protein